MKFQTLGNEEMGSIAGGGIWIDIDGELVWIDMPDDIYPDKQE